MKIIKTEHTLHEEAYTRFRDKVIKKIKDIGYYIRKMKKIILLIGIIILISGCDTEEPKTFVCPENYICLNLINLSETEHNWLWQKRDNVSTNMTFRVNYYYENCSLSEGEQLAISPNGNILDKNNNIICKSYNNSKW